MITISYLRHGNILSGGAIHEETFVSAIEEELKNKSGIKFSVKKKIKPGIFRGLKNFSLFFWGIKNANADINIVVFRLAISSILRNIFSGKKTLIILHHYDKKEKTGKLLKAYYVLLFCILKRSNPDKVAIVTVSPFFHRFFRRLFPELNVYYFPNLFYNSSYKIPQVTKESKKILLGQFSLKNDHSVFYLAENLSAAGYKCFFTTLRKEQAGKFPFYEIKMLDRKQYLHEIKSSFCAITLPYINEGWNRMMHECLLLGTPVAGFDKGGLGDLLRESGSKILKNADEAIHFIQTLQVENAAYKPEFFNKYDIKNATVYIKPILPFITGKND